MLIPHFEEDRSISNGSLRINVEDAILAIFIYIIILVFSGVLFRKNGNSLLKMFMFNSLIAIVMFIITTILFHVLHGIKGKNISGKSSKKFTIRNLLYVTIVILGSRVISNDLVVFILTPFSKILMTKSMLEALNEVVQVPFLAYVCIIGPAMEELVFRGGILGGLLKTYSVKKSIIISSILFGVVHLNGIPFTILGVLFIIYGLKKINGFKIDIC
ncbi:CPBP family intramembrane glutamic endopeptidase [Clostridium kluyveri]|uniref:CAAX prenyl protease 2/Lysostaphin resistance protein A-like domain-containing protein n=1 Tax=Clostridium kluyveri TaxID=1534 RepID=A0A1L5FCK6_CLOKL|nr:type II CAAX endopeptidase family protein [Clostridium kluyveri]APM40741.1 hypothetical protein BS101_19460 [Clostridium kluyveri]